MIYYTKSFYIIFARWEFLLLKIIFNTMRILSLHLKMVLFGYLTKKKHNKLFHLPRILIKVYELILTVSAKFRPKLVYGQKRNILRPSQWASSTSFRKDISDMQIQCKYFKIRQSKLSSTIANMKMMLRSLYFINHINWFYRIKHCFYMPIGSLSTKTLWCF